LPILHDDHLPIPHDDLPDGRPSALQIQSSIALNDRR
jgi:hypothetical protein